MSKQLQGGQPATERPPKLFTLGFGVGGTGKTSLGLSHPSPLYIMNLDRNMDTLLQKLPSHYEIHYEESLYDVEMSRSTASETILKTRRLVHEFVNRGEGTFFMDGADLYWDQVKMAKIPDADVPNQWGPANSEMESLLRRLEHAPGHVYLATIASAVWGGMTKETNQMKADGFKHIDRFINTKVFMFCPEDYDKPESRPRATTTPQTHSGYVPMSKLNEKVVGSVFPNPSFKMLYRSVFREPYPDADNLWVPS